MRDLDSIQEHEAKQQRLVEGIVQSLHAATRDDENYRQTFAGLAQQMLVALRKGRIVQGTPGMHPRSKWENLIAAPICAFTKEHHEQRLLLVKVFEKVFASYASGVYGEYHRLELEK